MTAAEAAPKMANMTIEEMRSVNWLQLERGRTPVIQSRPNSRIAATMVRRSAYQPKVSMGETEDLADAMIAGSRLAAERTCTHPERARVRVEAAGSIHFGSLMRDVLDSKGQSKAPSKTKNAVHWHPRLYRKSWAEYING